MRHVVRPAVAAPLLAATLCAATDSPWFRGPNHDGTYPDATIRTDWEAHPPRVLWSKDVGYGFSGFAVAGRRALTAGHPLETGKNLLYCFDAASGAVLWQAEYADRCGGQRNGLVGPSATPAIEGNRVYMPAVMGALYCFDLDTGRQLWAQITNRDRDLGVPHGEFGDGVSPVIFGDLVLVHLTTGTNSAAWFGIQKADGQVRWSLPIERREAQHETVDRAYSPAAIARPGGRPLAILISNAAVVGVDPLTGRRAWTHSLADLAMTYGPFPEPAMVGDDRFFYGLWYGNRANSILFRIGADGLTREWTGKAIGKGAYTYVIHKDHVYGYGAQGLQCVELATGKLEWKWRSLDPKLARDQGEVILAGDKLVWISSSGMLYVGEASPDRRRPLAEFQALGKCAKDLRKDKARYNDVVSTSPALANGRLYCRSGWGEAVCLEIGAPP
jgi:outer membrane protein assembly factor BamB